LWGESGASGEVDVDGAPHGFEAQADRGDAAGYSIRVSGAVCGTPRRDRCLRLDRDRLGGVGGRYSGGLEQLVDPPGGVTLEAAPPLTPSNDPVASPPAVRVGGTELKPTKILEPADLGR
jgi:hypothetical protein